jgi:hypothetical protein
MTPRAIKRRAIAQSRINDFCLDCRNDTASLTNGAFEYYMVHNALWAKANPQINGMLCVGCLENRIGRQLMSDDFTDMPINTTDVCGVKSKRLASRLAA